MNLFLLIWSFGLSCEYSAPKKNHWIQQHESGLKHSSEIIKQKKKTVSSMGTSHNLDERIRAQRWQVPPNSAIMLETVFSHQLGAGCRSLQRVFRLFFLHDHYCSQTTTKTTTKTKTETELLHRHVLDWKALLMRRRSDSSSIITLFLNQTHTHTQLLYSAALRLPPNVEALSFVLPLLQVSLFVWSWSSVITSWTELFLISVFQGNSQQHSMMAQ